MHLPGSTAIADIATSGPYRIAPNGIAEQLPLRAFDDLNLGVAALLSAETGTSGNLQSTAKSIMLASE
ncbi:hypothetical protein D4A92_22370 (plasmid) [Rhizobium rosettiformans]|uniref:Uncharacterized protein n=1 Tax=Rhizobium rosettiformans TaxID=1368430 RepID=A0ABX7F4G0_9HYPH|nr:hypothetical protein [Rhizobium rosettiformans]QRF54276.1 hypothetical protein D4A92_22370 [Rhizobium rosettiformans]